MDEARARRIAYGVAARLLYALAALFLVLPWILEQPLLRLFNALNMNASTGGGNVGNSILLLDFVFVIALAATATVAAVLAREPRTGAADEPEAPA